MCALVTACLDSDGEAHFAGDPAKNGPNALYEMKKVEKVRKRKAPNRNASPEVVVAVNWKIDDSTTQVPLDNVLGTKAVVNCMLGGYLKVS
jgi:hypothetical protein